MLEKKKLRSQSSHINQPKRATTRSQPSHKTDAPATFLALMCRPPTHQIFWTRVAVPFIDASHG
ncbi:hypothetical protein HanRHA438_Chr10g0464021 [Helianthus annuus]|nr:hypothetical protein HanRHA438_Chr10g0464021 [Helianthus annuus]